MISLHRYGRVTLIAVLLILFGVSYGLLHSADDSASANITYEADGKQPAHVLIIRHGEKANDDADIHLNSRGAARAAALPSLFAIPPNFPTKPAPFKTPDFLYAARQSKHSNRSVETVTPLAQALDNRKIHDKHKDDEYQSVVDAIFSDDKHADKIVMICWHHGNIPELAVAVAAKARNAKKLKGQIPDRWEGAVFDRVWRFTFDATGAATFANEPQRLLFGDSKK